MRIFIIAMVHIFLLSFPLLAAEGGGGDGGGGGAAAGGDGKIEIGPNFGVFLPSGLAEVNEVVKNFGIHGAFPVFGKGHILVQYEYGRGGTSTMTGLIVDFRTPAPTGDDFSPYFLLGPHLFFARGTDAITGNTGNYLRLGFNFGGGFFAKINEKIYFDFMLRVNAAPGTFMYIGAGFNFLLN
jgi:hypothetical protein